MSDMRNWTEEEILRELAKGPRLRFGGSIATDRALQSLRRRGAIVYRKVKDGGNGWELSSKASRSKGVKDVA